MSRPGPLVFSAILGVSLRFQKGKYRILKPWIINTQKLHDLKMGEGADHASKYFIHKVLAQFARIVKLLENRNFKTWQRWLNHQLFLAPYEETSKNA